MSARILLLEDDHFCLGLLETVLISEGYDVVVCDTPADVVERAQSDPSALALVDFWGRSQLVLATEERDQLVWLASQVPTILVTARSWADRLIPADLGLLAIILKPFGLSDLYTVVSACAARANNSDRPRGRSQGDGSATHRSEERYASEPPTTVEPVPELI